MPDGSPGLPAPEPLPPFASPAGCVRAAASALQPPSRMSVAAAAAKWRRLNNPGGGYTGPWRNEAVPPMVEPMEAITDRRISGVVFVGPAQSTKTSCLIQNPILHAALSDPAEILVVHMTQTEARLWSMREVDKMIGDSPALAREVVESNVFDKSFRRMRLLIGWPAKSTLAGKPISRVLLTDYDRMPDDIGGEGSAFVLAQARIRTFGSRGVVVAESSPSRTLEAAEWAPEMAHEAPPVGGILALYNQGDRRLWHWPCVHCGEFFEASREHMSWPDDPDLDAVEIGRAAAAVCPHCGGVIGPEHKEAMNAGGRWVPAGCVAEAGGTLSGDPVQSQIRSYWLKGPAAPMSRWSTIVTKLVQAERQAKRSDDESALKTVTNTDWAYPYTPRAALRQAEGALRATALADAAEDYPLGVAPEGARFVTAAVDVQGNRFEILFRAWALDLESWVIGHEVLFQLPGADGEPRMIDPALNAGDWDALIDKVFRRAFTLAANPARGLVPASVAIDTGGKAGVTENAYQFYRRQRGYRRRMALCKGTAEPKAPRVRLSYPDSQRKDRHAGARGEIPVYFFQANLMKDAVDAQLRAWLPTDEAVADDDLAARVARSRAAHLPTGLLEPEAPHEFLEQLTAETRLDDGSGKWIKRRQRNEALDLMCMSYVPVIALKADRIDVNAPPAWAREDGGPLGVDLSATEVAPAGPAEAAPSPAPMPAAAAAPARRGRRVRSRGVA